MENEQKSSKFKILRISDNHQIALDVFGLGYQGWRKVHSAKNHVCFNCELSIPKGESAFAPMRNPKNRTDRLCINCLSKQTVEFFLDGEYLN